MYHPYQCLDFCSKTDTSGNTHVVATSGPVIYAIELASGRACSSWPEQEVLFDPLPIQKQDESPDGPPEKRRKISGPSVTESNFTILKTTPDGLHIVGVTGEDKCVRVFEIGPDNTLTQLSSRCMPKRPCAISFTSDSKYILCGDKFGDIYSLPLLPTPAELELPEAVTPVPVEPPKPSLPAASVLTVHSGRNRQALENQMKQPGQRNENSKQSITFKHDLLLGHVSMLTDVASVTLSNTYHGEAKPRSYIFSADRDEHIRVSRGAPQAHIIEGFCHGHKEFVNSLCVIDDKLLLSGGGDDHLYLWDWPQNKLLLKVDLRSHVQKVLQETAEWSDEEKLSIRLLAVSGLWLFRGNHDQKSILAAVEGVPALFSINGTELQNVQRIQAADEIAQAYKVSCRTISLPGNALDVAIGQDRIVVSIDNLHESGSTVKTRAEEAQTARLVVLRYEQGNTQELGWIVEKELLSDEQRIDSAQREYSVRDGVSLTSLLYGAENLRKRGGLEGASDE